MIGKLRDRISLLAWGVARWYPGRPLPVRLGSSRNSSFIDGPEMTGLSNQPVQ
jgi:hypothetical protein